MNPADKKDIQEVLDEAYLTYVKGNYAYALWEVNLRIKWERLCLSQSGFIPDTRKQIPQAWRERIKAQKNLILNFLDCSRMCVYETASV